jgi:hypothetical protein
MGMKEIGEGGGGQYQSIVSIWRVKLRGDISATLQIISK